MLRSIENLSGPFRNPLFEATLPLMNDSSPDQSSDANPYQGAKSAKKQLLGNHQKCWIWGRNAVVETLKAGHWKIWELLISNQLYEDEAEFAMKRAEELNIDCQVVDANAIKKQTKADDHQGYAAKMTPFPYQPEDKLLETITEQSAFAILDGIQDPHNLGAIIRSAEVLNLSGIILPSTGQVGVTSVVARTSAGAVNHLPIYRVADLSTTIENLKQKQVQIFGMAMKTEKMLPQFSFQDKAVAVIIGNEAKGIRAELLDLCDDCLAIPVSGKIDSLNAAVAAGVVFYEINRQKNS